MLTLSFQQHNLLTHSYDIAFLSNPGCINTAYMPNTHYTDYSDYKVFYIISEVNVSGPLLPPTGIHCFSNLAVGTSSKSAHTIMNQSGPS